MKEPSSSQHSGAETVIDVERLFNRILEDYRENPVDLLGRGDGAGEYRYLLSLKQSNVRTVQDVLEYAKGRGPRHEMHILEIGPFLGVVSLVLAGLGFKVTVSEIKEYMDCLRLQRKFREANIEWAICNLRDYRIPFRDAEFDVVIMCSTLEHLNFNPLPVIDEINRIMKPGGLLYLAVPNLARAPNRMKLLSGRSILNPIRDYFAQLDGKSNMIVGLHWREYTAAEIREMLENMDYAVVRQNYDLPDRRHAALGRFRQKVKKAVHCLINLPGIRPLIYNSLCDPDDQALNNTHITFAVKRQRSDKRFYFTDATRGN